MIDRLRQGDDSADAGKPIGRLESRNATVRCRITRRAALFGTAAETGTLTSVELTRGSSPTLVEAR